MTQKGPYPTPTNALWNKSTTLARLAGNENLLQRIVDMYLAQIENKQRDLRQSIEVADVDAIRFHSHSIKGVSGDVGADAVKDKAAEIETLAIQNKLDTLLTCMEQLDQLISATIIEMQHTR